MVFILDFYVLRNFFKKVKNNFNFIDIVWDIDFFCVYNMKY